MPLRTAHGANSTALLVCEPLPADELPPAQATEADPLAAGRDLNKRVRTTAAARALAKLPRKPKFPTLACDPAFAPYNARRLEWQRQRMAELAAAHGAVSRGVGAMVNAAAWQYAAAEFASATAARTGNVDMFKSAATLAGQARQQELTAWELAARESQARARQPGAAQAELDAFWAKGREIT